MSKFFKVLGYAFLFGIVIGFIGCQQVLNPLEPIADNEGSGGTLSKEASSGNRFIVQFDRTVNEAAQEALIRRFGEPLKSLPIINGAAVLLPPTAVADFRKTQGVVLIEEDRIVEIVDSQGNEQGRILTKPSPPTQPPESIPWGVDRIDADLAWNTSKGDAVKAGILDTGIDPSHPDLKQNVKGGINTINPLKSYKDDNGHGTHVAGTVAAVDNETGVIGVGPLVSLYAIKAFNRNGMAFTSDIIEGIQWCITNGIQIINMSFGASTPSSSEEIAIKAAYDAGITMVAAAGNSGPGDNTVLYPARYPETIAVTASDQSNKIANWSSRGIEVDLIAPGVSILSTYLSSTYRELSGTSMATPHVTGTAALVLKIQPGLSPLGVKIKLQDTAKKVGLSQNEMGAGLVDAAAAVGP